MCFFPVHSTTLCIRLLFLARELATSAYMRMAIA